MLGRCSTCRPFGNVPCRVGESKPHAQQAIAQSVHNQPAISDSVALWAVTHLAPNGMTHRCTWFPIIPPQPPSKQAASCSRRAGGRSQLLLAPQVIATELVRPQLPPTAPGPGLDVADHAHPSAVSALVQPAACCSLDQQPLPAAQPPPSPKTSFAWSSVFPSPSAHNVPPYTHTSRHTKHPGSIPTAFRLPVRATSNPAHVYSLPVAVPRACKLPAPHALPAVRHRQLPQPGRCTGAMAPLPPSCTPTPRYGYGRLSGRRERRQYGGLPWPPQPCAYLPDTSSSSSATPRYGGASTSLSSLGSRVRQ